MKLFVLRHGDAEPKVSTDQARSLSAHGVQEVQRVLDFTREELSQLELMLVSPYQRAQQTAELVQSLLPDVKTETTPMLTPESSPLALYGLLQQRSEQSILLVSHQPLVGAVVNELCGADGGYYAMDTANLACIDCDVVAPSCGNLRWLQRPDNG